MAFDPSGQRLAATYMDTALAIWDVSAPTSAPAVVSLTVPEHPETPAIAYDLAWSPDGKALLLGTSHGAWIWDVAQHKTTVTIAASFTGIYSVSYNHEGTLVVIGDESRGAFLADATSGALLHVFEHRGPVRAVAFSPDGTRLVSAADDLRISVWDTKTFEEVEHIDIAEEPIRALAVEPTYNSIITGSGDRSVRVWNLYKPDELQGWIEANRYVPDLSCDELANYGLCEPGAQETLKATP
jgi:WD40 repeat protein